MRVRAPFEQGSTFTHGKEIYFSGHLSSDLPDEIARELMARPGYSRYIPQVPNIELNKEPQSKETFISPPIEIDKKEKTLKEKIIERFFLDGDRYLLKNNPYFKIYSDYFTFSLVNNRDNIDVSIIIPTRNRLEDLCNCIKSIYEFTHELTYEIIVVDGSDDVDTFRYLCKQAPIFVVKELVGGGVIKAFNRGFIFAEGKYIVWLNDDVLVEKNWLNIAYNFMESKRNVGLGCIFHKEGALAFGKTKPDLGYIWDGDYCVRTLAHFTKHPGMAYANFGIIKRDLFKKLGFWNEKNYRSYVADTDLSHRVWEYGLDVVPILGSRIVHLYIVDDLRRSNHGVYKEERKHYESVWRKR